VFGVGIFRLPKKEAPHSTDSKDMRQTPKQKPGRRYRWRVKKTSSLVATPLILDHTPNLQCLNRSLGSRRIMDAPNKSARPVEVKTKLGEQWPVTISQLPSSELNFSLGVMTLNFNATPMCRADDAKSYRGVYLLRRERLAELMICQATSRQIVAFHLQEVSSRWASAQETLSYLCRMLNKRALGAWPPRYLSAQNPLHRAAYEGSDVWTAVGPFFRHGGSCNTFGLATIYNTRALHLNRVDNYHFGGSPNQGAAVRQFVATSGKGATSNACLLYFSLVHPNGLSVDSDNLWIHANTHLPLTPEIKSKALTQLLQHLVLLSDPGQGKAGSVRVAAVTLCGDLNTFAKNAEQMAEVERMIDQLGIFGYNRCARFCHPLGDSPLEGPVAKKAPIYYVLEIANREECDQGRHQVVSTFVGTHRDLRETMKLLDAQKDPHLYKLWLDAVPTAQMLRTFRHGDCQLMDWIVHKSNDDQPPSLSSLSVKMKSSAVWNAMSLRTIPALSESIEILEQGGGMDWGDFISDHWSVTSQFDVQVSWEASPFP